MSFEFQDLRPVAKTGEHRFGRSRMRNVKWLSGIGGIIVLGLLVWPCQSAESTQTGEDEGNQPLHTEPYVYVGEEDEIGEYAAYLTWKNYDGYGDPEDAVFVWNGKEVGKGSEGLESVIGEMKKLPRGSRILVFPSYAVDLPLTKLSGNPRVYPFSDNFQVLGNVTFRKVVQGNELVLLISPRDNKGKLLKESTIRGGGKR